MTHATKHPRLSPDMVVERCERLSDVRWEKVRQRCARLADESVTLKQVEDVAACYPEAQAELKRVAKVIAESWDYLRPELPKSSPEYKAFYLAMIASALRAYLCESLVREMTSPLYSVIDTRVAGRSEPDTKKSPRKLKANCTLPVGR